jgi:quercetin dioxygenase-like cupin family protein
MSLMSARHYLVKDGGSLWPESPVPGVEFQLLAGARQSEGGYSLIRSELSSGVPEHTHEHDDESIYLLEGEMAAVLDGERFDLSPGDFLYMPRKQRHELIIETPVRMLHIETPGGTIEKFMEAIGEQAASAQGLDAESYVEIQHRFGFTATSNLLDVPQPGA